MGKHTNQLHFCISYSSLNEKSAAIRLYNGGLLLCRQDSGYFCLQQ